MQDIRRAHQMFYSKPNKTNQDEIILCFTKISPVKRNRSRHNCFKKNETIKYYLPKRLQNKSLKNIRVCKEMFLSTFQVGKRRVEGVCKRFFSSGECPQEGRGGDVRSAEYADRKLAVKTFIENLQPIQSHYERSKNTRKQYLPSELSIKSLLEMYNS